MDDVLRLRGLIEKRNAADRAEAQRNTPEDQEREWRDEFKGKMRIALPDLFKPKPKLKNHHGAATDPVAEDRKRIERFAAEQRKHTEQRARIIEAAMHVNEQNQDPKAYAANFSEKMRRFKGMA